MQEPVEQFGQRGEVDHTVLGIVAVELDLEAVEQHRRQAGGARAHDIVVVRIADVQRPFGRHVHLGQRTAEDLRVRLADAPRQRRDDNFKVVARLKQVDIAIQVDVVGDQADPQRAPPQVLDQLQHIVVELEALEVVTGAVRLQKGGVVLLTKAMAYEYIERGIRVNAVAPGGIQTSLMESFGFPENASRKLFYKITSPMGFAQPEEVAGLMAFLASDEARYMTGAVVPIDGGMTS